MGFSLLLELRGVTKTYRRGRVEVVALRDVSFALAPGRTVAMMGPSGSGKTTLLNLLAGLDRPGAGEVIICGQDLAELDADALTTFRRRHIGFVFQFFNLLPTMTARDNVALPLLAERLARREIEQRTMATLDLVGMTHRADHRPDELSGGEQQRVAIARALVMRPRLLLADEPTGNLDSATAGQVLRLFGDIVATERVGIVMVTHSGTAARAMGRIVSIRDGRLREAPDQEGATVEVGFCSADQPRG